MRVEVDGDERVVLERLVVVEDGLVAIDEVYRDADDRDRLLGLDLVDGLLVVVVAPADV
ncbi:hypothetical protein MUB52_19695 [Roseobacter sp. WL0113]|uniref:Uncharacterized protein n=1 Tax=Roseobacter sinensis TaxID=2931391 RepID=A0ABT3BJB1_9RHOB|nr:hypothetical protein [Roseobacter sp. WL0113]